MKPGFANHIRTPVAVALIALFALALGATAGSLTPPGAVSSTMHSLAEIYDSIASATFDSSAIVANQNGSLLANLKYIESQVVWASSSGNIWNLNSGNMGIGTTNPTTKLQVVGAASISSNFEVGGNASASALFGSGLTDCDGTIGNMAINWDITTGRFSCTIDDVGSAGSLVEVRESSAANGAMVSSLSFNAGGFDISFNGIEAIVKLDYINGPASRSIAQTITGAWNFTAGASVSPKLEIYNITGTASLELFSNNDAQKRFTIQSVLNGFGGGVNDRIAVRNNTGTELVSIASSGDVFLGLGEIGRSLILPPKGFIGGREGGDLSGASTSFSEGYIRFAEGTDPFFKIDGGDNNTIKVRSDANIDFKALAFTFMPDTGSGNVGIGTSTPSARLHIIGAAGIDATPTAGDAPNVATVTGGVGGDGGGGVGGKGGGITITAGDGGNGITSHGIGGDITLTAGNSTIGLDGNQGGNIMINPGTGKLSTNLYGNVFLAQTVGNVGIGVSNIDAKFEIQGNSSITTSVASISGTGLSGGSIFNITVPASTSANNPHGLMLVKNVNGTVIASWSMGGTLALRGRIISRGSLTTCTGVNTPNSGCIDYAESYPTTVTLSPGDVVTYSEASGLQKATSEQGLLGVISTNPAVLITGQDVRLGAQTNEPIPGTAPVAMSGRVPVKISFENGPIITGDHLAPSTTKPGFAMRATQAGMTVGMALENANTTACPDPNTCTVLVFVNTSYWAPQLIIGNLPLTTQASSSWLSGTFQNLFAAIVDAFRSVLGIVFERGKIQADQLCAGAVCVNQQQLQELLNSAGTPAPLATPTPNTTPGPTPTPSDSPIPSLSNTPTPTPGMSPPPINPTPTTTP